MKMKQTKPTVDKSRFPRLKGMVEKLKNKVVIASLVSAAAVFSCSDGPGPQDGGPLDASVDADTPAQDGGESLCPMYPEGHANRKTFQLDDVSTPGLGDYHIMFRQMEDSSSDHFALFVYYKQLPGTTEFISLRPGSTKTKDIPGLGPTTFELCSTSGGDCSSYTSPPEGDANCTATIVSDRVLP